MRLYLFCIVALPVLAYAEDPLPTSEKDFFADLPISASVSRMPQPVDEIPAALTIIDHQMIRLSGARNLADLLRLVPGFQVNDSVYYGQPHAVYHGGFNEFSNRMQVLIDGRSVYSPFRLGDVGQGMQSLALEDIERIEVIRGSDSTAYGARAMLGVINIVTLNPLETRGVLVGKSGGGNGVDDNLIRLGWGEATKNFRLTTQSRRDNGLAGSSGASYLRNANIRADFQPTPDDVWQFRTGFWEQYSGSGHPNQPGDPQRDIYSDSNYVQLDWRRSLDQDSDIATSFSHSYMAESNNFVVPVPPPYFGVVADFGGSALNDAASTQYTVAVSQNVRVMVGAELRREESFSVPLYNKPRVSVQFRRLFGNLEWHIVPSLVLNAGTMFEHSSMSGSDSAPRVVLNWHLMPGQTVRIGTSEGHRPPSMFETSADVRYVVDGTLLRETFVSRGQARPENVSTSEFGYLGDFPSLGASVDVRVFREHLDGMILPTNYALPPNTNLVPPQQATDFVNTDAFTMRGVEYQLKLRIGPDTRLLLNQSLIHNDSLDVNIAGATPEHASSLVLYQRLPGNVGLSLADYRTGAMGWQGNQNRLTATRRTDLRLGMPFRVGSSRCEVALTVQNVGQPYNDFLPTFEFRRQTFASLSVEL